MSYVDKYEKRFDAENFCNFMVLTNFNAIKGANGRRYLALDMNVSPIVGLLISQINFFGIVSVLNHF